MAPLPLPAFPEAPEALKGPDMPLRRPRLSRRPAVRAIALEVPRRRDPRAEALTFLHDMGRDLRDPFGMGDDFADLLPRDAWGQE